MHSLAMYCAAMSAPGWPVALPANKSLARKYVRARIARVSISAARRCGLGLRSPWVSSPAARAQPSRSISAAKREQNRMPQDRPIGQFCGFSVRPVAAKRAIFRYMPLATWLVLLAQISSAQDVDRAIADGIRGGIFPGAVVMVG